MLGPARGDRGPIQPFGRKQKLVHRAAIPTVGLLLDTHVNGGNLPIPKESVSQRAVAMRTLVRDISGLPLLGAEIVGEAFSQETRRLEVLDIREAPTLVGLNLNPALVPERAALNKKQTDNRRHRTVNSHGFPPFWHKHTMP